MNNSSWFELSNPAPMTDRDPSLLRMQLHWPNSKHLKEERSPKKHQPLSRRDSFLTDPSGNTTIIVSVQARSARDLLLCRLGVLGTCFAILLDECCRLSGNLSGDRAGSIGTGRWVS